jgi:signal transduction histidine kinase
MGLGLAIVESTVTAHGGAIDVGDRDGGGAVFTVTLPSDQEKGSS